MAVLMKSRRITAGAVVVAAAFTPGGVRGQGYPPDQAAAKMTAAEGLSVRLVASEPMVRQPVCIEFDPRGRLWVVQYLQYPNPAGLKRVKVDRWSRTVYDRVPEPPPRGPKGEDRITILEDTDGDGRADRAKDFITGLNLASGIAFGHGGVFVLNVPYLLYYPDKNGDDVPDADPDVLLTGFGMEDAHSVANSLTWGPDGWLYGCQGSTVTTRIRGIEFQQGVWRYHPITHRFELFCEGGGNMWGMDFDATGELFYSTNYGGFRMLHGVQGAYYWKSIGKHGPLHNPYAYGYFDHVPHEGFHGGHVTAGGIVYQGLQLPERFRGRYVAADLLGHAAVWADLEPWGSTFKSRHAGEVLQANDTWFAPDDMTVGPDGALYISDFHDRRTAHPDPDAEWDRSNGRIYRIESSPPSIVSTLDLLKRPTPELIGLLGNPDEYVVRRALRALAERRDPAAVFPLRRVVLETLDDRLALRALWGLYVSGGFNEGFAAKALAHRCAPVRRWTVRLLGDEGRIEPETAKRLADLAEAEKEPTVIVQLACSAKRLPASAALPILDRIARREDLAKDPYIPLLVWWAVEAHASPDRDPVLALCGTPESWKSPILRDVVLSRLCRRAAALRPEPDLDAVGRLLDAAPEGVEQAKLLEALDQGLGEEAPAADGDYQGTLFTSAAAPAPKGAGSSPSGVATTVAAPVSASSAPLRALRAPESLLKNLAMLEAKNPSDVTLIRISARLGRSEAVDRALALAVDAGAPADTRVAMLGLLGDLGRAEAVPTVLPLVASDAPEPVRIAAVDFLRRVDREEIADALLRDYGKLAGAVKARTIDLLLGRRAWAKRFLEAVDAKAIPAADATPDQVRTVAAHGDPALDAIVRKHWGSLRAGTPEEELAEMRRLSNDLRADPPGDPARGRETFRKTCATCHTLFGEGQNVGPDLTHANRADKEFLLTSIVDPSAAVRRDFLAFAVQTKDGRVLTGIPADDGGDRLVLVAPGGTRVEIPRSEVEAMKASESSLMPENLYKEMTPQELRDLFSYLQSQ